MITLAFVGEKRSPTARRNDWRWNDGRLAAKQLFDALRACGEDPGRHCYLNLFEPSGLVACRLHSLAGDILVAMGRRVQKALARADLPYIALTHPAARGAVRRKDRYAAEVRLMLALAEQARA